MRFLRKITRKKNNTSRNRIIKVDLFNKFGAGMTLANNIVDILYKNKLVSHKKIIMEKLFGTNIPKLKEKIYSLNKHYLYYQDTLNQIYSDNDFGEYYPEYNLELQNKDCDKININLRKVPKKCSKFPIYRSSQQYNIESKELDNIDKFNLIIDLRGKLENTKCDIDAYKGQDDKTRDLNTKDNFKLYMAYLTFYIYGMRKLYKYAIQNKQIRSKFIEILRKFTNNNNYPILFHCVHGKDRTGILAAFLMILSGYDIDEVSDDYSQSELNIKSVKIEENHPMFLPKFLYETKKHIMMDVLLDTLIFDYLENTNESYVDIHKFSDVSNTIKNIEQNINNSIYNKNYNFEINNNILSGTNEPEIYNRYYNVSNQIHEKILGLKIRNLNLEDNDIIKQNILRIELWHVYHRKLIEQFISKMKEPQFLLLSALEWYLTKKDKVVLLESELDKLKNLLQCDIRNIDRNNNYNINIGGSRKRKRRITRKKHIKHTKTKRRNKKII